MPIFGDFLTHKIMYSIQLFVMSKQHTKQTTQTNKRKNKNYNDT